MDSFLSIEQHVHNVGPVASSVWHLLEAGLLYVRQEHFVEGLALLTLARERLSTDQAHLAAVLDAFVQSHDAYSRAQKELLKASKHFVRAEREQQVQLTALERLLSNLLDEMSTEVPGLSRIQQHTEGNECFPSVDSQGELKPSVRGWILFHRCSVVSLTFAEMC